MKTYQKYKDSGIEWIGEIPEEWTTKRLKYVVSLNDETLAEKTDEETLIDYIEIGDLKNGIVNSTEYRFENAPSRARRIVRNGDVIVSTVRTYLKAIAQITDDKDGYIASTGFAVLRPKNISSKFLGYYSISPFFIDNTIANSVGVTYPAINASNILEFPIQIPSTKEQTTIANYLDRKTADLDQLIEEKKQLVKLYQEEKIALVNQAVTKGINLKANLKDSDIEWLGDIPEHWEFKPLKTTIAQKIDNRGKTPKYGTTGVPMLEVKQISEVSKYPIEKFEKFVDPEILGDYVREELAEGDILIATVGATAGKCCIVPKKPYYFIAQNVIGFRFKKEYSSTFIYFLLQSTFFKHSLYSINKSNTIDNLKVSVFVNSYIPVPPINEQLAIADFLETLEVQTNAKIKKAKKYIELLTEYRTSLISEVVTGKIKVID